MFAVYADGHLLYDTTQEDKERILLNMKICLEANTPGKFSFVMPPGHVLHGSIENQKTNITVEQDGEIIFYGRVINTNTDRFNQISVNCECALAYFLDSPQRTYEFEGTPLGLFRYLIDTHNEMVEEEQRFTIGIVTAISDSGTAQVKSEENTDTLQELKSRMINAYGGYLRVRTVDGVHYIDYLADGDENAQEIEIGVNLLDLQKNITSDERFNVLIPYGAMQKGTNGRYTQALTIKEVNNGLDYLIDEAAVAQCGKRIWKFKTWDYITDAAKLKEKGTEYLATGISDETTLTVKAVDMHFIDKAVQRIGLLHKVRILSNPHGVDVKKVCQKIEGELIKPEEMQYTFGKPRLTLTDNIVIAKKQSGGGGSGKTLKEEVSDLKRWATVAVNENIANIELNAGEINNLTEEYKNVVISLDGIKADLLLYSEWFNSTENELTRIEVDLNAMDEDLLLKVDKNGVIGAINLSSEEARIAAGRIVLDGYVTASQFEALSAEIGNLTAGYTTASWIRAENLDASIMADLKAMRLNGNAVSQQNVTMGSITSAGKALTTGGELDLSHSHDVTVNDDGTITLGEVSAEGGNFKIADTKAYKDGVSAAKNGVTFDSASWTQGRLIVTLTNDRQKVVSLTQGTTTDENKIPVLDADSGATAYTVDAQPVFDAGVLEGSGEGYSEGYTDGKDSVTISFMGWESTGYAYIRASNERMLFVPLPPFSWSKDSAFAADHSIKVYFSTPSVSSPLLTATVHADSVYKEGYNDGSTAGKASVTLSASNWQGGVKTVTASNGQSVAVNLPDFSVSGGTAFDSEHKTTVYFHTESVNGYLKSQTVDASGVFEAGRESVALQEKTVTENGTITPDEGFDGFSVVTVNVPSGGGTIVVDDIRLGDATGPVPTQAGLASLASGLGTTSDKLVRCFSSVTVSNSGYYGFSITVKGTTKYYYFIVT